MIPGFPAPPAVPSETPAAFVPPPELAGEWQGIVQTHQGEKPLRLSIKSAQELSIEIDGRPGRLVPVQTPLGPPRFHDGWFSALFFGTISTDDASRSPHVVFVRLQLRGDTLRGTASAVAMNQAFSLPYWASLMRK